MANNTGVIFEVKHFAVHDGPGIRTTVFLKGCPLKCVWCHNPEGISKNNELSYLEHKCVSCGRCVSACPNGAHTIDELGKHHFNRSACTACGKCVSACFKGCLTLYGRQATVDELMVELLEDKDFYDSSADGGVTLSGGECLMQSDFCLELLRRLKEEGIHTAVDTCGFTSKAILDKVMPYTDIFLYDLKAIDEQVHVECTGQSNAPILENLKYLSSKGKKAEIRVPYVPNYNSGEIEKIGKFLQGMPGIVGVRVLPYHNYAETKYVSLGIESTLPKVLPTDEEMKAAEETLKQLGITVLD